MHEEKTVSYTTQNTYYTLNTFTAKTKKIWLVCHGIGYLSTYFLDHFKHLDPDENYIIAPQAPSKYYQDKKYKYVGASWFTRVNTQLEIQNVTNYLDQVYVQEISDKLQGPVKLTILGYSQGVSAVTRWLAHAKVYCDNLVLHSGSTPREFHSETFKHLNHTKVSVIYGTEDMYLSYSKMIAELNYLKSIFNNKLNIIPFKGKHEVHEPTLLHLSLT
ncbi:alpha/beta hydrolase [Leeuwenhoekiella sp. W20_SRS_FM14]|uniref:alpha/beta hydrolase n=1 Tax=Leeuwenhoekiella sp. W20_SRS_FM14 TaxID=3240270 RepID=UPI003F95142C